MPFFGLTFLLHLYPQPELKFFIGHALISYAALIVSFLGGARWGLALRCPNRRQQSLHLGFATIPPLLAWILLYSRLDTAIAAFAVLFAALGLIDSIWMKPIEAPQWYSRLRVTLSVLVVASLVGAMFAL